MFNKFYTTQMSANHKQLQTRFVKMRSKSGRFSKIMAAVMTIVLVLTLACVTIVVAAVDNEPKNFFINDKGYAIKPVLVENSMATHTDNYYVPLRDTFEALGYKVYYDVDKAKYSNLLGKENFPVYDNEQITRFFDSETNEMIEIDNSPYYNWLRSLVTDSIDIYIYGSTGRINPQMPIIEMEKDGITEYCQIGSQDMSFGYSLAPILIDGKTYIPLRAVANIAAKISGEVCVAWNDESHDTYFTGAVTFDETTMTVNINLPQ